jgi:hypothetical protein
MIAAIRANPITEFLSITSTLLNYLRMSFFWRNGIITTFGKRIAAQNPPDGQPGGIEKIVLPERFEGIARTGGIVLAGWPEQR